jgi:hypothetical protein
MEQGTVGHVDSSAAGMKGGLLGGGEQGYPGGGTRGPPRGYVFSFFYAALLDMFSAYSTCLEMDLFDVCALHPFFFYISQFYQLFYLVFLHTTNQGRL